MYIGAAIVFLIFLSPLSPYRLELAKKGVKPKLELAYTTSDLYDLPDLTPPSWADLVERYIQNTVKLSPLHKDYRFYACTDMAWSHSHSPGSQTTRTWSRTTATISTVRRAQVTSHVTRSASGRRSVPSATSSAVNERAVSMNDQDL